jgi:D-mannonate dehydratase
MQWVIVNDTTHHYVGNSGVSRIVTALQHLAVAGDAWSVASRIKLKQIDEQP